MNNKQKLFGLRQKSIEDSTSSEEEDSDVS